MLNIYIHVYCYLFRGGIHFSLVYGIFYITRSVWKQCWLIIYGGIVAFTLCRLQDISHQMYWKITHLKLHPHLFGINVKNNVGDETIFYYTIMVMSSADSRRAPGQWETSLQSNAVSHWLGANLESALDVRCRTSQLNASLLLFISSIFLKGILGKVSLSQYYL